MEGDAEARQRADRIAQEIERNVASKIRAQMENDDEERDLDKETPEFQLATQRRTSAGMRYAFLFISENGMRNSGYSGQ